MSTATNNNDGIRTMNELRYHIDYTDSRTASAVCRGLNEYAKALPLTNNTIIEFYEFSITFFDRIFGEDTTNRMTEDLPKSWQPYRRGGWFRILADNKGIQVRNQSNNNSYLSSEAYSLFQVLSINSSLMDVLKRGNKNFDLDVKMLPFKVRMLLQENLSQIGSPVKINEILQFVESPNLAYLQNWFLNPKVLSPRKDRVILSPFKYFLTCLLRYPTMDEYIFYPKKQIFSPQKYLGVPHVLQFNPYFYLVRHYIDALLVRGKHGEVDGSLSIESEWFLRLAVEYWLNPADVVRMRSASFNTKKYRDVRLLGSPTATATTNRQSATSSGNPLMVMEEYNPLVVTLFDDNPPAITTPSLQVLLLFGDTYY